MITIDLLIFYDGIAVLVIIWLLFSIFHEIFGNKKDNR